MLTRRHLLAGLAAGAAGLSILDPMSRALAQTARKRVMVGGRPATVVDIHAHCVIKELTDRVPEAKPPAVAIPDLALGPNRFALMNERGIDFQVLSINQYWWYAADRSLAERIVSVHDEALAAWCKQHPDRFVALSSVALQFPDLAAEQLDRAVNELGLRGASIGGHVNNEPLSSEKYDPFWAKAEALGVPVFMHPNGASNIIREGGLDGPVNLGNMIGNPLETTAFLTKMIVDGTLDRFPRLKLCCAHGGGYLPSYIGRTVAACTPQAGCRNKRAAGEYLKDQVMVDTMVFSEEGIRHLVAETGVGQVVYGTDIPYTWPDTLDLIVNSPSLSDDAKRAILGGNLVELLHIKV